MKLVAHRYYSPILFYPPVSPFPPGGAEYNNPFLYSPFFPPYTGYQKPGTTTVISGSPIAQHTIHVPLHGH